MLERSQPRWILAGGGFHTRGGTEKMNYALAKYLSRTATVHLIGNDVDPELQLCPSVCTQVVPYIANSDFLSERSFRIIARRAIAKIQARHPHARVIVNGGICEWRDINWVHAVHHAWKHEAPDAPLWFRAKNRLATAMWEREEKNAVHAARMIIANSDRTARDLEAFGCDPQRIRTVHLGCDPSFTAVSPEARACARQWIDIPPATPTVSFIGALGFENHKGFDLLWTAWQKLCIHPEWNAVLLVVGNGRRLEQYKREAEDSSLADCVRFMGHTDRVRDVLAASDLLISPVRYEAFGLNVQEAVCRGIPAFVTGTAGVAEMFPEPLRDALLPASPTSGALVERLTRWLPERETWKTRFAAFSQQLRRYTWDDMCERILAAVDSPLSQRASA